MSLHLKKSNLFSLELHLPCQNLLKIKLKIPTHKYKIKSKIRINAQYQNNFHKIHLKSMSNTRNNQSLVNLFHNQR